MLWVNLLQTHVHHLFLQDCRGLRPLEKIVRHDGFNYQWMPMSDPVFFEANNEMFCEHLRDIPF